MNNVLTPLKLWVLGIVLGGLLGALGLQTVRLSMAKVENAELRVVAAKEGERTANAVAAAIEKERVEEQRRRAALEGIVEDAERLRKTDQVAATDARTERDRLRVQVAAFVAARRAPRSDPQAPTPSASAGGEATDLLAELFNRADDRAGALAEIADDWHTRLVTCNRAYDALTPSTVALIDAAVRAEVPVGRQVKELVSTSALPHELTLVRLELETPVAFHRVATRALEDNAARFSYSDPSVLAP